MTKCTVRLRVISTKMGYNSSSIFDIWGLILMQLSFSFRESNAIFTNLSLLTVMIIDVAKQLLSTSFVVSRIPNFISFSSSRPTSTCRCSDFSLAFVLPDNIPVRCLYGFIVSNKSGNLLNTFSRCDLLFTAD